MSRRRVLSPLRLGALALIPLLGLAFEFFPITAGLERLSYDLPFIFYRSALPAEVVLIYLDEESARALNQPLNEAWDRSLHAQLLDRLVRDRAKLVYYDIVFSSPSTDPRIDRDFARAIQEHGAVILGAALEAGTQNGIYNQTIYAPTEVLRAAAAAWGLLLFDPVDPDYAIRELPSGTPEVPTASWVAARQLGSAITAWEDQRLTSRWLNYYGPPGSFHSVSFRQALSDDGVPPDFFANKIVLLGGRPVTSGIALGHDEFANPYSRWGSLFMTGLEVHATELSNLARGEWLSRMPRSLEILLILGTGIIIGLLASFVSPRRGIPMMAACAFLAICIAFWSVWHGRLWFNWLVPVLVQVPIGIVWSAGAEYFSETRRRSELRRAFAFYLSPEMADRIAESDFDLQPGAQLVEATVVFTDLEGFTALAEELHDPIRTSELLIEYFTKTSQCILQNHGTIIKYIGDSVLAAWGAPVTDLNHPIDAARSAWELHQASKLVVLGRVLVTRLGLSTGMVAAGNLGSPTRFDYTVVGDTVNLASRLESLNKLLGTNILISEATCHRLNDLFLTRLVGHFALAGKTHSIPVHELFCPKEQTAEDYKWINTFEAALGAIRGGDFSTANAALRQTVWERGGSDGPSEFYLRQIAAREKAGDLQTWTGVVNLLDKN